MTLMKKISFLSTIIGTALTTAASAYTLSVDPGAISISFDQFNDGVSTATNFGNMADGGEAGGVSAVTMPAGAADPQFQYLTPGGPFDPNQYPFMRIQSQGSAAGASQVFPLPANGATVLPYTTGNTFSESQLQFAQPLNGTGLRIDPLGGGTGGTETFSYDYLMLDRFQTIGLGEFDRDGGLDGWTPAANGHLINTSVSSSTSTFTATTAGNDPVIQKAGLNVDTATYKFMEISLALDPASNSRFEFFWGTNTFPGPAGGQSIAITNELIRDGNLHTYRFDMSDEANWDGNLNILRLDLLADADAQAGRNVEIGHVRLYAQVPEPSGAA
ncbi:MAG: hypothetical protein ACI9NC_003642, partial [Verrucomicrobiales bacterium]